MKPVIVEDAISESIAYGPEERAMHFVAAHSFACVRLKIEDGSLASISDVLSFVSKMEATFEAIS
jgi:hypothetical protein